MRALPTILALSITLLASCKQHSGIVTTPQSVQQDIFLTNAGTLNSTLSRWSVRIDEISERAKVTQHTGTVAASVEVPNWRAQPGWFACVGADERVWVYDGQTNLCIVETNASGGTVIFGLSTYPRPVPLAIRNRLSSAAQQLLKHE